MSMLLDLFTYCSRLQINHIKSAFFGFGPLHEEEILYSKALGMPIENLHKHYLGLLLK